MPSIRSLPASVTLNAGDLLPVSQGDNVTRNFTLAELVAYVAAPVNTFQNQPPASGQGSPGDLVFDSSTTPSTLWLNEAGTWVALGQLAALASAGATGLIDDSSGKPIVDDTSNTAVIGQ